MSSKFPRALVVLLLVGACAIVGLGSSLSALAAAHGTPQAAVSKKKKKKHHKRRCHIVRVKHGHHVKRRRVCKKASAAPGGSNKKTTPAAPSAPGEPDPIVAPGGHPYISLADYAQAPVTSAIYKKFKAFVDRALAGDPEYEYSATVAVTMYSRTGEPKYIEDAIKRVEAQVKAAEADFNASPARAPLISEDDYLEVGGMIEELALAYDYGIKAGLIRTSQAQRWKAYGDRAIANIWNPDAATWGSQPAGTFPWSGWSIDNPGNNYNYSFIEATQMWALATQNQTWIAFLRNQKFPEIQAYYAGLPGGGSREGTGYGTAQRQLWANARIWRDSTGEDLPAVRQHARESIEYWINATVPTLDYFAPIGDLSRESVPALFDYQENLVREAMMAAPGSPEANNGAWWLKENSVPDLMTQGFTLRPALLQPTATAVKPTALTYHAAGVGQFFARSSWEKTASWLQFTAGPYDESHAHEDQGGFTFFRNTWLTVSSAIWSSSGLQGNGGSGYLGTEVNNVVRFQKANGQTIHQNHSDPTETSETVGNVVKVHADLTPAYSSHQSEVKSWKRDLEFQENTLKVHDSCQVGSGVTPTFQLHVPVKPVNEGGGKIKAGALQVIAGANYGVKLVDMQSVNSDFTKGWRIDLTNPGGCEFDVTLNAGP